MSGDDLPLVPSLQPHRGGSIAALDVHSFTLNSMREAAARNNSVAVGNHLEVFLLEPPITSRGSMGRLATRIALSSFSTTHTTKEALS